MSWIEKKGGANSICCTTKKFYTLKTSDYARYNSHKCFGRRNAENNQGKWSLFDAFKRYSKLNSNSCICIVINTTYIELIKFQYILRFSERSYTGASEWKFWKQLFSFRFENFLSLFEMNCRSLSSKSKWDSSCFAISSVTFIKSLLCDFIWQIIQNIIGSIRK